MKKNFLLLLSLMLLLSVSAIAGPRSYQQAKAIAQRQAAMLGIEMDAEVAASAKAAPPHVGFFCSFSFCHMLLCLCQW